MIKILYVDDEPDIREIAVFALKRDATFEVRPCASGEEALAALAEWQPNLILLDVVMPKMDGPATLARLRDVPNGRGVPVIFITARTYRQEIDRLVALGAIGVIPKPFNPMTLASVVKSHLQTA
jgi:two-component system OmpR family response regulator